MKASMNPTEFVTLAQKYFIKAVAEGSSEANIFLNILSWYSEPAEMKALTEGKLNVQPLSGEAHYLEAKAHMEKGEFREAIKSYEAVLAIDEKHERARRELMQLYLKLKRGEDAKRLMRCV